jgi:hypothetical protein
MVMQSFREVLTPINNRIIYTEPFHMHSSTAVRFCIACHFSNTYTSISSRPTYLSTISGILWSFDAQPIRKAFWYCWRDHIYPLNSPPFLHNPHYGGIHCSVIVLRLPGFVQAKCHLQGVHLWLNLVQIHNCDGRTCGRGTKCFS